MNKRNIEGMFSKEMDAYANGIERSKKVQSEEYNELLELGKKLTDNDFSKNSNKEEVFNKTLKNINKYRGEDNVKKSNKTRHNVAKVASFALVCILGFSIMQTSFAQDFVNKIVKTISLGHITIVQEEPSDVKSCPVPAELKGKIFDKDGKPVEELSVDKLQKIYTVDGEEIAYIGSNGEIITVAEDEKMREEEYLVVKDSNELNDYTCFNVILPSYLPDGFTFDRAELYKDEDGTVENSKYIDLYFTNEKTGKYIFMQQRFADEETGYVTGANKVEEVKINGVDTIISDDRDIAWEANGVLYNILGRGEITRAELIRIAESIK
ncbi:DUF4367 domain-containing protein [Sporanaerobacter acetigenes]|uniref:DUF4367 domain-containing protein n=1 Tax=Sporanaerobacter acetigenes DSM 13106 TaxID=1123281 RepID=A0A1M5YMF7_9FIRM|nr:DUF4367 domain-containing protein [Sporanaerobacter acetigenes]SHI13192.1 protein of unknown function [Sporanaerobacter acetigenes DSM 13106]